MNRFFLFSLVVGTFAPLSVSAETWWLMAAGKYNQAAGSTSHTFSIPTTSQQECEFAGQKFLVGAFPYTIGPKARGYVCVKGK